MRLVKDIFVVLALMFVTSCERYIDLNKIGPERLLVVNANLLSGDTLQTFLLSWSLFDAVKPVESAHLEFYVNGELAATSDDVHELDRFSSYVSEMKVKATFKEGDKVKIKVASGESHAEITAIAPTAPKITSVDTTEFSTKDKQGDVEEFYMAKVSLSDVPGENNYYRIIMSVESEFYASQVSADSGYKEGQFLCNASKAIDFDNTYESLLYKKMKIGMDSDSDDKDNYYANKFNLFTDNSFADGAYTLKLAFGKYDLYNYYPGSWSSDMFRPVASNSIRFRVLSMSRSSYNYMNDYAFDMSDQGDWTFIGDIPYPSNVKGGTGMVSVMTPADYYVRLGNQ